MVQAKTIRLMNDLVALHAKSLPAYLMYATPTWHRGDDQARVALENIAAQQAESVDRLGAWIVEHDGVVNHGHFPMTYTAYHDLSFSFLLKRLIEYQQNTIRRIESVLAELFEPEPREMTEELLGEAKAHLDTLTELKEGRTAGPLST